MRRLAIRIFQSIIVLLVFLLPFHAFGVTFASHLLSGSKSIPLELLKLWKEALIMLVLLTSAVIIISNYKKTLKKWDEIDTLITLFSLLAFVIALLQLLNDGQPMIIALGIKYDLLMLWLFFAFRHLPKSIVSAGFIKCLLYAIFISGTFVVVFGLIQKFSANDFLVQFGYLDAWSVSIANEKVSFCQYISNTQICRIQSFLAGPIRLGSFLIVYIGITSMFKSKYKFIPIILACLVLFWTFSRSAWLALLVYVLTLILINHDKKVLNFVKKKGVFFLLLIGVTSIILGFIYAFNVNEILIRPESSFPRLKAIKDTFDIFISHPFGLGFGFAGPASNYLPAESIFLNENWYLQILVEMGILGIIMFALLLILILKKIYQSGNKVVFAILIAISFMGLFTHVWEESATTYISWILIGLACRNEKTKIKQI